MTKAHIQNRIESIILQLNYATLVNDENMQDSLCQPFQLMAHSILMDMTLKFYEGKQEITIDDQFIKFKFNRLDVFLEIKNSLQEDLKLLN